MQVLSRYVQVSGCSAIKPNPSLLRTSLAPRYNHGAAWRGVAVCAELFVDTIMPLGKLEVGCLRPCDVTTMKSILTMRRPVGRPKGTKRPTGSINGLDRGKGQLCGVCFRGGGVDGGAWGEERRGLSG